MLTQRQALVLAVPLLLVSACSDGDEEPTGTKDSATPSVTAGADEIDYPDEGVDLVDPPVLKGIYQRGAQTYVDFERGRRLAAMEGKVNRLLSFNATADVVDPYRAALRSAGSTYDGGVVVEFLAVQPQNSVLRLDVCVDGTGLVVPEGAPAVLGEASRSPQQIVVTFIEGVWRVTGAETVDGSC